MRVPFIDIPAQYCDVKARVDASVAEILSSGGYVLGKYNKELEERIAERHGVKHAIAVNSGTDALKILMQAAGVQPGDEVITTSFTFVATVETVVQLGAKPVFIDIKPDTFNIDPDRVAEAITTKTKAILPVHLFGQLAEIEVLAELAQKHNLLLLEDAAQAIDSHHKGRFAGSFGQGGGLSFYVTKNLGAAGDGGMILTHDEETDRRCRSLRIHGMGRERYMYDDVGHTSRMAELQAAFLCAKLDKLSDWTKKREQTAKRYLTELAETPLQLPVVSPGNNCTWHQFTVHHPDRDKLMAHLKERQVDSGVYYPVPLHLHDPYKPYVDSNHSLYESERAGREVLSLPVHPHLSEEQVDHVVESIKSFFA